MKVVVLSSSPPSFVVFVAETTALEEMTRMARETAPK
jgi:hypothetical protein